MIGLKNSVAGGTGQGHHDCFHRWPEPLNELGFMYQAIYGTENAVVPIRRHTAPGPHGGQYAPPSRVSPSAAQTLFH